MNTSDQPEGGERNHLDEEGYSNGSGNVQPYGKHNLVNFSRRATQGLTVRNRLEDKEQKPRREKY